MGRHDEGGGHWAISGRLLDRRIFASEAGGRPVNVTRATDTLPPATVDGVRARFASATARFCSVSELFAWLGSGTSLAAVTLCEMSPGPVVRTVNENSMPNPVVSMGGTSQVIVLAAT